MTTEKTVATSYSIEEEVLTEGPPPTLQMHLTQPSYLLPLPPLPQPKQPSTKHSNMFEHADAFTQLPSVERLSRINANKYAINNNNKYNGYSTTYNQNMGSLPNATTPQPGSVHTLPSKPCTSKNGPKVNAITYGSLAGFDTDFNEHKHGWHSVGTGYIGYNGSQLNYSGSDTTMNGGLLGYTHTFYKGNFWSALTATAGACRSIQNNVR